jgi:ketosteroid isomerase-like protein
MESEPAMSSTVQSSETLPQSTAAVIEQFLSRLGVADADADGVGELFADEIDWYVPGHADLPWTGRRRRREDVPEFLRTLWSHFVPGRSRVTLDRILVDGEDAVVFSDFEHTVSSTGHDFQTPTALRFRVVDGWIVKMQLFEDTFAVSAAFFD